VKYKEATLTYSSPQSQTQRKAVRIRDLGQLGNLGAKIVLGPLEHPSPLVVDDEERDSVDRVAARNRAADEVDHDVASAGLVLIAAVVGQFGHHGPVMPQPAKARAASSSRLNGCGVRTLL
jgi:hypothetical protein